MFVQNTKSVLLRKECFKYPPPSQLSSVKKNLQTLILFLAYWATLSQTSLEVGFTTWMWKHVFAALTRVLATYMLPGNGTLRGSTADWTSNSYICHWVWGNHNGVAILRKQKPEVWVSDVLGSLSVLCWSRAPNLGICARTLVPRRPGSPFSVGKWLGCLLGQVPCSWVLSPHEHLSPVPGSPRMKSWAR